MHITNRPKGSKMEKAHSDGGDLFKEGGDA